MIIQSVTIIIALYSFVGAASIQTHESEAGSSDGKRTFVEMASGLKMRLDAMEADAVSSLEAPASAPRTYFARREHTDEAALLEGLDKAVDWGSSREADQLMDAVFEGVEQCRTECSIGAEISRNGPSSDARQLMKEEIKSEFKTTRHALDLLASLHPPALNPSIAGYKNYVNTKEFTSVIALSILVLCAAMIRKKSARGAGFETNETPNASVRAQATDDCGTRKTDERIVLAEVESVRGGTQTPSGSEIAPDKALATRVLRTNGGRKRRSAKSTTVVYSRTKGATARAKPYFEQLSDAINNER